MELNAFIAVKSIPLQYIYSARNCVTVILNKNGVHFADSITKLHIPRQNVFFVFTNPYLFWGTRIWTKKNKMGLAWPQFCGCFMSCRLWNKRKSDIVSCQFYSIFSLEGGTDDNTEEEASDLDHGTVSWWCPGPEFPLLFFLSMSKNSSFGIKESSFRVLEGPSVPARTVNSDSIVIQIVTAGPMYAGFWIVQSTTPFRPTK